MFLHQWLARIALACTSMSCVFVGVAQAGDSAATRHVHGAPGGGGGGGDSFYYTDYEMNGTSIIWFTCGYNSQEQGCFGSGSLGPFGRPCAVAGSSKQVVVADVQAGVGVPTLSVYKQVESATPSATLVATLNLPSIPTSPTAHCFLSIGGKFAYFGTDESSIYYQVNLATHATTPLGICGGKTSSITANDNFVIVSQTNCFAGYDLKGNFMEDGGETADYFVPGKNAFTP